MGRKDHCRVTAGQTKARNFTECLFFSFYNKAKYHNQYGLENDPQSVENEVVFSYIFLFFVCFSPSYSSVPAVPLITTVYITVVRTRECVCVTEAGE